MKGIVVFGMIFCGLFFVWQGGKAQTMLEFSQVLLVNSNVQTVPVGKVWKVSSIAPTLGHRSSSSSTPPYEYYIQLNGQQRYCGHGSCQNTTYSYGIPASSIVLDFWLPAGTTLAAGTNVGEVSVIEFNVIP